MTLKDILNRAFNPSDNSLNVNAVITLTGLALWVVITLGEAFGFCLPISQVKEIGSMIFGLGVGRASKEG